MQLAQVNLYKLIRSKQLYRMCLFVCPSVDTISTQPSVPLVTRVLCHPYPVTDSPVCPFCCSTDRRRSTLSVLKQRPLESRDVTSQRMRTSQINETCNNSYYHRTNSLREWQKATDRRTIFATCSDEWHQRTNINSDIRQHTPIKGNDATTEMEQYNNIPYLKYIRQSNYSNLIFSNCRTYFLPIPIPNFNP